jgi:hypothetical protein
MNFKALNLFGNSNCAPELAPNRTDAAQETRDQIAIRAAQAARRNVNC